MSKKAPTTEAPTTEAPATEAPATEAPATEAPATEAKASGKVKVRITKMGTRTCGCIFAKGAEIVIPIAKAKLLEELNQGTIIGTP